MFPSKSFMVWWQKYHNASIVRVAFQFVFFTFSNVMFSAQQSVQRIGLLARISKWFGAIANR